MNRRPVRQQQGLVALADVGLEVAAAGLAVVDAQAGLSFESRQEIARDYRRATGQPLVTGDGGTS